MSTKKVLASRTYTSSLLLLLIITHVVAIPYNHIRNSNNLKGDWKPKNFRDLLAAHVYSQPAISLHDSPLLLHVPDAHSKKILARLAASNSSSSGEKSSSNEGSNSSNEGSSNEGSSNGSGSNEGSSNGNSKKAGAVNVANAKTSNPALDNESSSSSSSSTTISTISSSSSSSSTGTTTSQSMILSTLYSTTQLQEKESKLAKESQSN